MMEVGVSVWLDRPARDVKVIAGEVERAGFSTLWVPDHYFLRDSFIALSLAAEVTDRIKLGTSVASPLLRHPTLLAASFATLQELSSGRGVVGLGTGGFEFEAQLGLPIRQPLSLVRESVEIVRALQEGAADLQGRHFTARGARLGWVSGPMPVFLAARGPRMLELSGEVADGVITHGIARSHLEFARSRLEEGTRSAGRSMGACRLFLMFDYEYDNDRDAALDRVRERCTFMIGGSYAAELIPVYGLDPGEVLPIRAAVGRRDYETANRLMTHEMIEAFAVGGPEAFLEQRLGDLAATGVEGVILSLGGKSVEDSIARIRRAGRVVAGA
jgi:5,10-methylenetetrahydromethanopterin reductase